MMTLDEALEYAQNALERAFEDWLESERPSGDCESVHRQWDESFAHQELADELQPVLALTWEVRRLREELDTVSALLMGEGYDVNPGEKISTVLHEMICDLQSLREENERLRKDAERYRWLIDQHWIQSEVDWRLIPTHQESTIEQLSKAIDAARGVK